MCGAGAARGSAPNSLAVFIGRDHTLGWTPGRRAGAQAPGSSSGGGCPWSSPCRQDDPQGREHPRLSPKPPGGERPWAPGEKGPGLRAAAAGGAPEDGIKGSMWAPLSSPASKRCKQTLSLCQALPPRAPCSPPPAPPWKAWEARPRGSPRGRPRPRGRKGSGAGVGSPVRPSPSDLSRTLRPRAVLSRVTAPVAAGPQIPRLKYPPRPQYEQKHVKFPVYHLPGLHAAMTVFWSVGLTR